MKRSASRGVLPVDDQEILHKTRETNMAKNKEKREQKKKKDRERRIAQEKLATRVKLAEAQKKAQERAASGPQLPGSKPKKPSVIGAAKASSFAANAKTPLYRRTGG